MDVLLHSALLHGGSGLSNYCGTQPHCPGAWGSGTFAAHCFTISRQWVVHLLLTTAPVHGRNRQWNFYGALPDRLGQVGCGTPAALCHTHVPVAQRNLFGAYFCSALRDCLGEVGCGTPAALCHTHVLVAQRNLFGASSHCLCALRGVNAMMLRDAAQWRWVVDLMRNTTTLPRGSGRWSSHNAPPLYHGRAVRRTPATHCRGSCVH